MKKVCPSPITPPPYSLRAMPDAESLIKATRGRFMFNATFPNGKQPWNYFWNLFPVCIISGLIFLLLTCGNAAFSLGYFVG